MSSEIITAVVAAIFGGGTVMGLVKAGYLKGTFSIGKNGNGTKTELDELHRHAEIANTEMGEINRKFDKLLDYAEKENDQHLRMLFILEELAKK